MSSSRASDVLALKPDLLVERTIYIYIFFFFLLKMSGFAFKQLEVDIQQL